MAPHGSMIFNKMVFQWSLILFLWMIIIVRVLLFVSHDCISLFLLSLLQLPSNIYYIYIHVKILHNIYNIYTISSHGYSCSSLFFFYDHKNTVWNHTIGKKKPDRISDFFDPQDYFLSLHVLTHDNSFVYFFFFFFFTCVHRRYTTITS